jgi:tetratricopeptide (TPR) repeat protein
MKCLKRCCLIAVASLALACFASGSVRAQSPDVDYLYRKVRELYSAARYAEALPFAQQLLAASEQTLSPDDPQLAAVLYDVSHVYRLLSRDNDAVALLNRALAVREKALGRDHPDVGQILIVLGVIYDSDGRFAEAEPLYKRVIGIAEKSRSPQLIAIGLNDLAQSYYLQGRYADALPLGERALAYMTRALKPDDPELAAELVLS